MSLFIEEHADATHVLLCGPGGVGKSTVLKGVTEHFTTEETIELLSLSSSWNRSRRIRVLMSGWITIGRSSRLSKDISWSKKSL